MIKLENLNDLGNHIYHYPDPSEYPPLYSFLLSNIELLELPQYNINACHHDFKSKLFDFYQSFNYSPQHFYSLLINNKSLLDSIEPNTQFSKDLLHLIHIIEYKVSFLNYKKFLEDSKSLLLENKAPSIDIYKLIKTRTLSVDQLEQVIIMIPVNLVFTEDRNFFRSVVNSINEDHILSSLKNFYLEVVDDYHTTTNPDLVVKYLNIRSGTLSKILDNYIEDKIKLYIDYDESSSSEDKTLVHDEKSQILKELVTPNELEDVINLGHEVYYSVNNSSQNLDVTDNSLSKESIISNNKNEKQSNTGIVIDNFYDTNEDLKSTSRELKEKIEELNESNYRLDQYNIELIDETQKLSENELSDFIEDRLKIIHTNIENEIIINTDLATDINKLVVKVGSLSNKQSEVNKLVEKINPKYADDLIDISSRMYITTLESNEILQSGVQSTKNSKESLDSLLGSVKGLLSLVGGSSLLGSLFGSLSESIQSAISLLDTVFCGLSGISCMLMKVSRGLSSVTGFLGDMKNKFSEFSNLADNFSNMVGDITEFGSDLFSGKLFDKMGSNLSEMAGAKLGEFTDMLGQTKAGQLINALGDLDIKGALSGDLDLKGMIGGCFFDSIGNLAGVIDKSVKLALGIVGSNSSCSAGGGMSLPKLPSFGLRSLESSYNLKLDIPKIGLKVPKC